MSAGIWAIDYVPGARTADICLNGVAVDVVQVRQWDWELSYYGQVSPVPVQRDLNIALANWVAEYGGDYLYAVPAAHPRRTGRRRVEQRLTHPRSSCEYCDEQAADMDNEDGYPLG